MASRTPQLRQSFLLTGVGVTLVLVIGFAALSGNTAQRTVEQQAKDRGQDVALRVAAFVNQYWRERRHEAEALAASPAVVRAAIDAAQQAVKDKLPPLDIPTLERQFNQRRMLGGDADLAAYLAGYPQRSDYAELFFTERHGYVVLSSGRTSHFVQSDEAWWQRTTVRTGTAETLVVTAPTNNGKWWVLFRQPTASAYAAARGTRASIFLWALLLFGATVSLLLLFRHRLNQRITEPVKAAGAIAS